MELNIRLTREQIKKSLRNESIDITIPEESIAKAIFKELKFFDTLPKKYKIALGNRLKMIYVDYDANDVAMIIYRKGTFKNTHHPIINYLLMDKSLTFKKRRQMR